MARNRLRKKLGLINTYWAVLMPHIAQGYFIFLMKGFFDSLPEELFDAARIDGCTDFQMFYRVAAPMCKPVLAVIALNSFRMMYGAFMMAILVCPKKTMWTIMVFLFEFQQEQTMPRVMAALTIAAIPTLLVFIFAQRTIIKGIIVPQMK